MTESEVLTSIPFFSTRVLISSRSFSAFKLSPALSLALSLIISEVSAYRVCAVLQVQM